MNLFINHKVEETNKEIVITLFVNTRFGYEEFGEEFLARGKNWLLKNEARKYVTSHLPNIRGGIVKVAFGSIIIASIPLSASAEEVNSEQVEMIVYTVQYEDNLYRIAQKFNVEIEQIKEINGIDNDTIYVGQELKIPNTTETIKSESEMHQNLETEMEIPDTDVSEPNETDVQHDKESFTYIVKAGDTLTSISNRYNVNIEQIRLMNGLTSDVIYIGQELKVFGQETKEEPVSLVLSTGITHPDVKKLKLDLEKLGYVVSNNPTNYYGPVTAETVREFQKAYGLNATGIADANTLQKLEEVLSSGPVLKAGITHPDVKDLKVNLAKLGFMVSSNPTNYYGPVTAETVREFQKAYGLNATGIADANTLRKLEEVLSSGPILKTGIIHPDVKDLKVNLAKLGFMVSSNPTNYYGPVTAETVREFQKAYGLNATGIADANTLQKLEEVLSSGPVLKAGITHPDVKDLKVNLAKLGFMVSSNPTNYYGPVTAETVREFQKAYGLNATGIADSSTLQKITEVLSADPVLSTGITHPDVKELKINLAKIGFVVSNNPTNYYGPVTAEQVGEFQRKYGLNVTGIADKNTLEALENILNGNPITEEQNQVILLREGVVHKNVLQLKEDLAKVGFKVSDNPNDYFGPITADTVREFQRSYNLPIDGIAGTETLQKLDELVNQAIPTPFNRVLKQGDVGEDVRLLQTYLNDVGFKVVDQPTANYASLTEKKVREFQQYHGLTPNGVADARTLQKLVTERAGIAESIGSFLITGKAYGHSVGMTQWGAYGMAQAGHTYDQILKYYYTGVGIGKRDTTNLNVRVLLEQNVDLLTISSNQPYQVGDKEFLPQTKTTIKYQNGEYLFENSGKSYKLTSSFQISSTNGGLLYFDNKQYEGIFTISTSNGKLDLINHLNVENYLKGVVPYEIIPSWNNLELYKAQTLAARTYVLKQIQANSNKKFDVYDTTQSQVYEGVPQTIPSQYVTKINQAIAETKGEVILYNGALIDAVYSASAGGHTVDAVDVWGNHIPYLVGKEDPYDQSRYSQNWWSYSITKSDLEKMFPELGTIISVTITETKYDRPTKIKVTGKSKEITLTGAEFRQKLGYNNLSSAVFTIEGIH